MTLQVEPVRLGNETANWHVAFLPLLSDPFLTEEMVKRTTAVLGTSTVEKR